MRDPYAPPRVSPLAVIAMILGTIALPLAPFLIGTVPGLAAVILGALALTAIAKRPHLLGGKGFAILAISFGLLSFPLALLLAPRFHGPRSPDPTACSANIAGTLKAANTYAAENNDVLPIAGTAKASAADVFYTPGLGRTTGQSEFTPALAAMQAYGDGNASASLWILAVQGNISPKSLVCRSDPHANPSTITITSPAGDYRGSPQGPQALSYAIASPWVVDKGRAIPAPYWRFNADTDVPLMADIAPLNGTGRPKRNLANGSGAARNSNNHDGIGQNIGFGDAHVEFVKSPLAGPNNDNIYTINEDAAGNHGTQTPGRVPAATTPHRTPDIMMIPMRDLNTGNLH